MNADNIIVIEDGCVIEQGNHDSLMKIKGKYFSLIEDQLDSIK